MDWHAIELASGDQNSFRYQLTGRNGLMTWREVLHAWSESDEFVDFYSDLLASGPFVEFRWETPPLSVPDLDAAFEFVIVGSRGLARPADPSSFVAHFDSAHDVAEFTNLGGDCVLVVPCPVSENDDFAHFGAFLRAASTEQTRSLWRTISAAVVNQLGSAPLWLSTAGSGVAWLHVRLDNQPKYYAYAPYRNGER